MSNHKTRPARSNSLQRMLELERRYMLERLQALPKATNPATSTPTAASSPARPTIQARRIGGPPQQDAPKDAKASRKSAPQLKPLVINVSSTKPKADVTAGPDTQDATDAPAPPNMSPDKAASKAVSFDVPPNDEDEDDRRSVCQSPSWEAYGRRKKEKKEEKKEQRKDPKREQKRDKDATVKAAQDQKRDKDATVKAAKDQKRDKDTASKVTLAKKKRLSKQPPPTSSSLALGQANRMVTEGASASTREKQRPASSLGLTSPDKDEALVPRPRPRSGSFTSLIKSSFELRRSSVEIIPSREPGFIGGIKLEIQRHAAAAAANQQTGDDKAKTSEFDIHPALRTGNSNNQRWSSPVRSPPPPPRPNGADAQRRAYPPITRHAKTKSLISPTAPDIPDIGTIDKWRAFVGLKLTPKTATKNGPQLVDGPKQPVVHKEVIKAAPVGAVAAGGAQNNGKKDMGQQQQSLAPVPVEQHANSKGDDQVNHVPVQTNSSTPNTSPNASRPITSSLQLEPPRRSPKRNSFVSLHGSISSMSSPGDLPTPPSPPYRPDSSGGFINDAAEARPAEGAPITSLQVPAESHQIATAHSIQPEVHSSSAKSSMDSSDSRNNELGTSGASLRPSTPRENSQSGADQKLDRGSSPTWEDIQTSVMRAIDTKISLSPIRKSTSFLRDDSDFTVRRLPDESVPVTSSSDDSSSDDFHSPSMPGTPDTSRPQSEKGLPPLFPDFEKRFMAKEEPQRVRHGSRSPARKPVANNLETVSGRATLPSNGPRSGGNNFAPSSPAAVQAMAQVSHTQQQRPGAQPRAHSEPAVTAGTSFLPKLKHQPLKPADKATPKQMAPAPSRLSGDEKSILRAQPSASAPWPASYLEEARKATPLAPPPKTLRSPQLTPKITPPPSIRSHPASSSSDITTKSLRHAQASVVGEQVAKMFVECCGCKYYHDLPSNLYEAMANPEAVIRPRGNVGFAGAVSMTVKCPWCNHEMSTKCCGGFAAMVYIKERLH